MTQSIKLSSCEISYNQYICAKMPILANLIFKHSQNVIKYHFSSKEGQVTLCSRMGDQLLFNHIHAIFMVLFDTYIYIIFGVKNAILKTQLGAKICARCSFMT